MTQYGNALEDFWDHIHDAIREHSISNCELGTVGWDDRDDHFVKGEPDDDGHTLVRVQLYRGKPLYKPAPAEASNLAYGHKVLAMVSESVGKIPTKGSRVYVLLPTGMEQIPGAGCIVAVVKPGREVNDNLGDGHATLAATNGAARVTVKENGEIVFFTTSDNTKDGMSVFLRIKRDGLEFVAPWGKLTFDDKGFHLTHVSGASIDLGAIGGLPAPFGELGSYIRMKAATISMPCAVASMANGESVQLADANKVLRLFQEMSIHLATPLTDPTNLAILASSPAPLPNLLGTNVSGSK